MSDLGIASQITYVLFATWQWTSVILFVLRVVGMKRRPAPLLWLRRELHPFRYWLNGGAWLLEYFDNPHHAVTWPALLAPAFGFVNCWLYRKDEDDDDRWKRRREKLASMVAEVGGRLEVVPVHAR